MKEQELKKKTNNDNYTNFDRAECIANIDVNENEMNE